MSKFSVGQRVRIVRAYTDIGLPHVGKETVVVEVWETAERDGYGLACSPIQWDGEGYAAWADEQLSPIVPDGHRSGDYTFRELMDRLKAGDGVPA